MIDHQELGFEKQELQALLKILNSRYGPDRAEIGHQLRQIIPIEVSVSFAPPSQKLPFDLSLLLFSLAVSQNDILVPQDGHLVLPHDQR